MKILPLLIFASFFASCANNAREAGIINVDISEGILSYKGKEIVVETSRVGIGHKIGSNRTPTGAYSILKEGDHRYGPSLRLDHYQGHSRGILIHKDFISGDGTSGCICPVNANEMNWLYAQVEEGTIIEINP